MEIKPKANSSVESLSQASLSITNSRSLLKLMSIELVMSSNHLILCCPLYLLPSIFPSKGSFSLSQFFASGGQSFSFSISPSNEYSGLISFAGKKFLSLLIRSYLFIFVFIFTSLGGRSKKDIAAIYIKECSAYIFLLEFYSIQSYI